MLWIKTNRDSNKRKADHVEVFAVLILIIVSVITLSACEKGNSILEDGKEPGRLAIRAEPKVELEVKESLNSQSEIRTQSVPEKRFEKYMLVFEIEKSGNIKKKRKNIDSLKEGSISVAFEDLRTGE